jgi:hypothetical protein
MTPMALLAAVVRQRLEKEVDRQAQAMRCRRFQHKQAVVLNGNIAVGWNHIDAVRFHLHPVLCLHHRHDADPLQQFRQHALMIRGEMLNHHKCHAAARRHMREKLLERFQSAGRCADGNNREWRDDSFVRRWRIEGGLLHWLAHGPLSLIYSTEGKFRRLASAGVE